MSRYEKAMNKAEKIEKAAKVEWENYNAEYEAICKEHYAFANKWQKEHPENKWGYNNEKSYKDTGKQISEKYNERSAAAKRYWTAELNFELKYRQWQDFLVRDSKRLKHCSCGKSDNSAMVQCDECDNWVHLICAGLTEKEAQALPEFICSSCQFQQIKKFAEDFIAYEAGEIDSDGNEVDTENE